jgi:hypothetical protein
MHPVLVCPRSKQQQSLFLPSLLYNNVPVLCMRSEARRGNLLVLYPVCGVKRWLASHDFRQQPRSMAPPHSVRASRQDLPSGLADGRVGPQLCALRSTGSKDYYPCKALAAPCCGYSASCRLAVETWRMHQCLFQRRARHWQRV